MDAYWQQYDETLDRVATCRTVQAVFDVLNETYPASSGDAFHPGGGDRDLLSVLEAGWRVVWMVAPYHYSLDQPDGQDRLTYIEGDVLRGDEK